MSYVTTRAKTTRVPAELLALALGGFGIDLTESVVAGLLLDIADQVHFNAATRNAGRQLWDLAPGEGPPATAASERPLPR